MTVKLCAATKDARAERARLSAVALRPHFRPPPPPARRRRTRGCGCRRRTRASAPAFSAAAPTSTPPSAAAGPPQLLCGKRARERERVCAASPRTRTRAHAHKRLPRRRRRASPLCQVYRAERTHVYMRMLSYNVCSSCACCCASGPAGQRASLRRRGRVTCTCTCTCTLRHSPPPARPAISACLLLGCVCLLAQNCRRSSPSRSPPRWLVSPTGAAAETFLAAALSPAGACAWHFPGRSRSRARFSRVACGHREATGPLAAAPPLGEALEALTARRSARSG